MISKKTKTFLFLLGTNLALACSSKTASNNFDVGSKSSALGSPCAIDRRGEEFCTSAAVGCPIRYSRKPDISGMCDTPEAPLLCVYDPKPSTSTKFLSALVFDWEFYLLANRPGGVSTEEGAKKNWLSCGLKSGLIGHPLFKASEYLEQYRDIRDAKGGDLTLATEHYIDAGYREGRIGRTLLDPAVYSDALYPTVVTLDGKPAPGPGLISVREHWITIGAPEGYHAGTGFRVLDYLLAYPNLYATYRNNYPEAIRHYVLTGKSAGLTASVSFMNEFFDSAYYSTKAGLPAGTGYYRALSHWLNTGIPSGAQAHFMFHVDEYVRMYDDLYAAFGVDYRSAISHFILSGHAEGRVGRYALHPFVFDWRFYVAQNKDVACTDYECAARHWLTTGIAQGRLSHPEFQVTHYLAMNPDVAKLCGTDYSAAIKHYITTGRKAGLLGRGALDPNVFDWRYYLFINPLLPYTDKEGATYHWLNHGFSEGRWSHPKFHVKEYVERYPDLQRAYGTDYNAAIAHYVVDGIKEGRIGIK